MFWLVSYFGCHVCPIVPLLQLHKIERFFCCWACWEFLQFSHALDPSHLALCCAEGLRPEKPSGSARLTDWPSVPSAAPPALWLYCPARLGPTMGHTSPLCLTDLQPDTRQQKAGSLSLGLAMQKAWVCTGCWMNKQHTSSKLSDYANGLAGRLGFSKCRGQTGEFCLWQINCNSNIC